MDWVDVAGCPGSGKSTVCYPVFGDKSVGWDGRLPRSYWRPFLDEITALCGIVQNHPTFEAVIRMNDRSAKKMATVERMSPPDDKLVFVQTGLVQRILGFGWRIEDMGGDINLIRRALWLMPVSVGVAFLEADIETILTRNRARELVAETAHENRSHQAPLMLASIQVAKEVLEERGIPVAFIDVQHQSPDDARKQVLAFAGQGPCAAARMVSGCTTEILAPPRWWM